MYDSRSQTWWQRVLAERGADAPQPRPKKPPSFLSEEDRRRLTSEDLAIVDLLPPRARTVVARRIVALHQERDEEVQKEGMRTSWMMEQLLDIINNCVEHCSLRGHPLNDGRGFAVGRVVDVIHMRHWDPEIAKALVGLLELSFPAWFRDERKAPNARREAGEGE